MERGSKALHDLDKEKNRLTIETTNPVSAADKVTFIFESERFLDEDLLKKGGYKVMVPVAYTTGNRGMSGTLQLSIDEIFLLEDMKMMGYRPSEQMGHQCIGSIKRQNKAELRVPDPFAGRAADPVLSKG